VNSPLQRHAVRLRGHQPQRPRAPRSSPRQSEVREGGLGDVV